jgi:hypothetical protein
VALANIAPPKGAESLPSTTVHDFVALDDRCEDERRVAGRTQ